MSDEAANGVKAIPCALPAEKRVTLEEPVIPDDSVGPVQPLPYHHSAKTNPTEVEAPGRSVDRAMNAPLLFQAPAVQIRLATAAENRSLIAHMTDRRTHAFADAGDFGLDEYDAHAAHLLAFDDSHAAILGAMRLGPCDAIIESRGSNALYLSRYWHPLPEADHFLKSSLELGRVWLDPSTRSRPVALAALWCGLGAYLNSHPRFQFIIGTVSLSDYPAEAFQLVAEYLLVNHAPSRTILQTRTREVLTTDRRSGRAIGDLRNLQRELRRLDSRCVIPPLLRLYATERARLLAPACYDETGRKMVVPLHTSIGDFRVGLQRMERMLS